MAVFVCWCKQSMTERSIVTCQCNVIVFLWELVYRHSSSSSIKQLHVLTSRYCYLLSSVLRHMHDHNQRRTLLSTFTLLYNHSRRIKYLRSPTHIWSEKGTCILVPQYYGHIAVTKRGNLDLFYLLKCTMICFGLFQHTFEWMPRLKKIMCSCWLVMASLFSARLFVCRYVYLRMYTDQFSHGFIVLM